MNVNHIIPIGDNCEIGGHLVRNNFLTPSLFRYALSEPQQITSLIDNDFQSFFLITR